ncbi:hypothetical protein [Streptomyces murinus]|uniref:Uncharacterized protein n=1 Tax=Streptomyces murinus TaxID=33900 RepID=A0A7W3NQ63_STRMR|nr:hypothetical protein [Streptomyces murinus]MBA9054441.1 hypothetical protein [Streptomyces murinus]
MTAVLHAGFAELDGLGPVTEVDTLHGETAQCGGGEFRISRLGG